MDKTKATPPTRADGARSEASSPASAAFFSATGSRPSPHPTVPSAAPFSASRSRQHATVSSAAPFGNLSKDMEKSKATPTRANARSEAASPNGATPSSASRSCLRPTVPFSASRSCLRPTVPLSASRSRMRPDVDYSKYNVKKMKKLRLVPEGEWFPHQRHCDGRFWTVVQKDLYLALKSQVSEMRWIDWPSVNRSTGTDVRRYFAATPGLDGLLENRNLSWAHKYIRQFYATLWIHPDRSRIKFMFGNEQRELSRDDFAKYLGLADSGARVHSLAYPNGNRDEVHLPPLESIRHLYSNPDAVMEVCKDHNQWNHETAVVHAVVRISIRPRSGGLDSLTTPEIWILHLLMSAKPVDVIDLMIGEMQEIILNIRRLLPYAPYLIHLFYKKGWLKDSMKNDLDQHLKPYKAPKPDDKRTLKNRAHQPVKSNKAPKPDGGRVGTRSLPPQVEAVFDDDEHAHLDRMLSPSLEERVTTNEEDDPDDDQHMVPALVPALVPDEFRFSQQGAHDAEAGGSGCHADVPPMLQSQADRQTAILEQIQGQLAELQQQHERDLQKIQGQLAELQQQSESDRRQFQGQLAELQRQRESDCQENRQFQGQLAELQRQRESDCQENQNLRNLVLLSLFQTAHRSTQHDDLVSLLNENLADICGHPPV